MPEVLEERQVKVEATLEQMDKRLSNVEVAIRDLNARIETLGNTLTTKIDSNFRWTIGIIISMWVTTMLAIITTIFTILLKG